MTDRFIYLVQNWVISSDVSKRNYMLPFINDVMTKEEGANYFVTTKETSVQKVSKMIQNRSYWMLLSMFSTTLSAKVMFKAYFALEFPASIILTDEDWNSNFGGLGMFIQVEAVKAGLAVCEAALTEYRGCLLPWKWCWVQELEWPVTVTVPGLELRPS